MEFGNEAFPFMRYGDTWRANRRLFHQDFNYSKVTNFLPEQIKYTNVMLKLIKDDPAEFAHHFKFLNSGIILEVMYGFKIRPVNDPYIKIAEDGLGFVQGVIPGSFLVDALPLLKYVPDWFPGAGFKKKAKLWGKGFHDSYDIPFEEVSKSFWKGKATPSFVTSWLSKVTNSLGEDNKQKRLLLIKNVSGTTFLAAVETVFTPFTPLYL